MITILLVDDEQTDRELMRHILQPEGHHVLEASNYSQAIEVFEQHSRQIDLLVADVALPERNGCELAKYLLKLEPELRVLFVSGFTGAEICKQYGVPIDQLHFLSKPLLGEALAGRIREILESSKKSPFPPGDDRKHRGGEARG